MVKNYKHQTRALIDENRNEIPISENLMNLITRFQDTVHDTAITYHRKLREKAITKSELDDIKGIGEAKKKELLKHFGSVSKIKQASKEELMQVKGITEKIAEEIAEKTKSDVIQVIGTKFILYRKNQQDPKIVLPKSKKKS